MQRRQFLATIPALPLITPELGEDHRLTTPPRLKPGDTVGLITPGSYITDDGLKKAVKNIESLGLKVKKGRHLRAENGFTAGTDTERLADLHAMFADPEVKGIWCARGGYGCGRLLPLIDYKLIRRNPKILIGYSDITALAIAITKQTGLVTYHGPVGSSDFTDFTLSYLKGAVMEGDRFAPIIRPEVTPEGSVYETYTITPGRATGPLWGGNLSLLASLVGTDYAPPVKGSLLFIEDIGEDPYRIDRMLTQLRQAWDLRRCAGIALGVFKGCEADPDDRSLTLRETLTERLGGLGVPVAYGLPIGHIADMCTLPLGVRAEMDTGAMRLRIMG